MESKWVLCPLCGSKTRVKLLPETVLKNYLLFCPKCKKETVIHAADQQVQIVRAEADAVRDICISIRGKRKMEYIRKAKEKDISRIAEILIFTKRMHYRSIFHNDAVSFGQMQVLPLARALGENASLLDTYWVYDDEFVKGIVRVKDSQIVELYVDVFFERQGIGKKLLEFAVQEMHANYLWVLEKNIPAISFYLRNGFRMSEERNLEDGTSEYIIKMVR